MPIVTTTLRLDSDTLRRLKQRAVDQDRSLASLLRDIIDAYLRFGLEEGGEERVAEEQRARIRDWSGTPLGEGFSGRDHDEVLYGKGP